MKKLLLILAIFITTTTFAQVPGYVPTNGLVGWWPFTGNANDQSGNGYNGSVVGASLNPDRFGNGFAAYSFDGSGNRIDLSLQQNNITQYTISAWFKTSVGGAIVAGQGIGLTMNIHTLASGGPGGVGKAMYVADGSNTSIGKTTNDTYLDNEWHHIVGVFNGATGAISPSQFTIYVDNGLEQCSDNNLQGIPGTAPINNLTNIIFGSHQQWGAGGMFNGILDDIGIWNRALTAQEVQDLFVICQVSVNTQPQSQTVNSGQTAQFVTSTSASNPTYQWQTDLGLGWQNLSNSGQYSGVSTNSLTVSNVNVSNNNQTFRCIITSGSCSNTTDAATLTVNTCSSLINTQPTNQSAVTGSNAQFAVSSNSINTTFQWQTDLGLGFQNVSNAGQYSGATTNTLTVSGVTMGNNNQVFRCILNENACIDTTNSVTLSITTGIEDIGNESSISILPNPTMGTFTINFENKTPLGLTTLEIFNSLGQLIQSEQINNQTNTLRKQIDLTVAKGIYTVRLTTNGNVYSQKLVVK